MKYARLATVEQRTENHPPYNNNKQQRTTHPFLGWICASLINVVQSNVKLVGLTSENYEKIFLITILNQIKCASVNRCE